MKPTVQLMRGGRKGDIREIINIVDPAILRLSPFEWMCQTPIQILPVNAANMAANILFWLFLLSIMEYLLNIIVGHSYTPLKNIWSHSKPNPGIFCVDASGMHVFHVVWTCA